EDGQCLLVAVGGLVVAALPPQEAAEVAQGAGVAEPVAELAEDRQGLLEVVGGLPVAALPPVHAAEAAQRVGFRGVVAAVAGGLQRLSVDLERVAVVPASVEVAEQDRGQA